MEIRAASTRLKRFIKFSGNNVDRQFCFIVIVFLTHKMTRCRRAGCRDASGGQRINPLISAYGYRVALRNV